LEEEIRGIRRLEKRNKEETRRHIDRSLSRVEKRFCVAAHLLKSY
jgi:hypothetical protein